MSATATQPTPALQEGAPSAAGELRATASEWFASGARRAYDPIAKTMLTSADSEGSSPPLDVFEQRSASPPAKV